MEHVLGAFLLCFTFGTRVLGESISCEVNDLRTLMVRLNQLRTDTENCIHELTEKSTYITGRINDLNISLEQMARSHEVIGSSIKAIEEAVVVINDTSEDGKENVQNIKFDMLRLQEEINETKLFTLNTKEEVDGFKKLVTEIEEEINVIKHSINHIEEELNTIKNTSDHRISFNAYGISSGNATDLIFPYNLLNYGNDYSSSTGKFTCSVPGLYFFSTTLTKAYGISTNNLHCYIKVNSVTKTGAYQDGVIGGLDGFSIHLSSTFHLDKNDYVSIGSCRGQHALRNDQFSSFTGFLITPDM